jgi:cytochrome c-type biogenesis protein CcmH
MNHDSATLLFLLLAAGMTAVALAFVLPRLWRGAPPRAPISRTAMNADIYRMELAELEAERDTGRLSAAEAAKARTELERRLLADAGGETGSQPRGDATRRAAVAIAVALPVLAAGLYLVFGEPGALATNRADAGFAATGAALTAPGMRAELVRHLERNPRDGRGWVLLGRRDAADDRFTEAAAAFERALAIAPKVAADPAIWCEYADALGMAQGGSLAGKPRELVMRALAMSPAHPRALEMAGSAAYEQREFDAAGRYWRTLLAQLPEGSPQHRELAAAVARAERLALPTDSTRAATTN